MARRRRSKGLSGSPEHHQKKAESAIRSAMLAYSDVVVGPKGEGCPRALMSFMEGAFAEGMGGAHSLEYSGSWGNSADLKEMLTARRAATEAIEKFCFVKPRRSRR